MHVMLIKRSISLLYPMSQKQKILMIKIELTIAALLTCLLLAAGLNGLFVESALLRPAQIVTVGLMALSVYLYLRLLALRTEAKA